MQLLSMSLAFIEHLCEFISDAFREVNRGLDATDTQSWDLVCFVVQQVFQSSFEKARRSVGTGASDPKNRLLFGSHLLLASIRTVHEARLRQSTGLSNHPIVSSSYVKFLMANINAGEMLQLKEECTTLTVKLEATASTAEAAKRTADSAVSTAKTAKSTAESAKRSAEAASGRN